MDVHLVVVKGSRQAQTIRLRSEETIVGRRSGCDLRIPAASVSRRHCRLSFRDNVLMVEDLDSANGTFVNGARAKDMMIVLPGDHLDIGPISFRVEYGPAFKAAPPAQPPAPPVSPPLVPSKAAAAPATAPAPLPVPMAMVEETPVVIADIEEDVPAAQELPAEIFVDESIPVAEAEILSDEPPPTPKPAAPAEAADRKPATEEPPAVTEDEISWKLPTGEDIRDILSQIEDS
jgi:predicted component of type VI protein secretion system